MEDHVADGSLLLAAALLLVGALLAGGAWLVQRRVLRYLLVGLGAAMTVGGVAALALELRS